VGVDNVSLYIGTDKLKTTMYLVLDNIYTCSHFSVDLGIQNKIPAEHSCTAV